MVKYSERIMNVVAVSAALDENGNIVNNTVEFEFEGHRNDGRVQRMVDEALKNEGYRASVVSIERTVRTYELPVDEFKALANLV